MMQLFKTVKNPFVISPQKDFMVTTDDQTLNVHASQTGNVKERTLGIRLLITKLLKYTPGCILELSLKDTTPERPEKHT